MQAEVDPTQDTELYVYKRTRELRWQKQERH